MAEIYIQDKVFEKTEFNQAALSALGSHFEDCRFQQCNFTTADLRELRFFDCQFTGCNLSLVKLDQTVLQEVMFKDCKLLGLHFEHCNGFGFSVRFGGSILDHSSFHHMKIPKTNFEHCELKGVDFTNADLSGAIFKNCNLLDAKFVQTQLSKADLSTAFNYSIDPEQNKLQKAKFSIEGLPGLLLKYKIQVV